MNPWGYQFLLKVDETHPGAENQGMTQVLIKPSKQGFSKTKAVDV